MSGVCRDCFEEQQRWLTEYPLVHPFRINSGAGWDDSPAGAKWRRERVVEDWKRTINYQTRLIARICQKNHQGADVEPVGEWLRNRSSLPYPRTQVADEGAP